jgi:hypothetical protein
MSQGARVGGDTHARMEIESLLVGVMARGRVNTLACLAEAHRGTRQAEGE